MRFPIYSVASNPSIDQPILRKKIAYVESLISEGSARWVDEKLRHLGVILRSRFALGSRESVVDGGTFDEAWGIVPSGPTHIGVWQLKTR